MSKYNYLGYEKVEYESKDGSRRSGYNIFITESLATGNKPLLRFDRQRKSNNFFFVSPERFNELGLAGSKVPSPIDGIYFDTYGNISLIQFSK